MTELSVVSHQAVARTPMDFGHAHFHPDHWQAFVLATR